VLVPELCEVPKLQSSVPVAIKCDLDKLFQNLTRNWFSLLVLRVNLFNVANIDYDNLTKLAAFYNFVLVPVFLTVFL